MKTGSSIKNMIYISLGAVVLAICSWISIPAAIPFTLQTFAVFLILVLLGGKRGTGSIVLYILLGIIGIPVFSGFRGGIGHIAGPTGGYIAGFIVTGLLYVIFEKWADKRMSNSFLILGAGLVLCYLTGSCWYVIVSGTGENGHGFFSSLVICVFPYIIPDAVKMYFAVITGRRLKKMIDISE